MPGPFAEPSARLQQICQELQARAHELFAADGVQIWVSDDLGFHPRSLIGRDVDDVDRALARRSCIEQTALLEESRLVIDLHLSDRRSGACLFSLSSAAIVEGDDALLRRCRAQVDSHQAALDEALLLQRLSRLSGSARQSDQLRSILALAHSLEHCPSKRAVLAELHRQLKELIYAENFFVVLLDEERQWLRFEYFVDQSDRDEEPIAFVKGGLDGSLSAFVVAAGRVLRGSSRELLSQAGHIDKLQDQHYGPRAHDWLGVPMVVANEVLGAVVIQSYDEARSFADGDPSVLSMIAETMGAALHRRRVREALERTVEERTAQLEAARHAAEQALSELRATQHHLVQAEKMASLGQLVAGVAHEANTPLGVALTANSHLQMQLEMLRKDLRNAALSPTTLANCLRDMDLAASMVAANLDRAARLVQNFKRVSVDRSSEGRRRFALEQFLHEVAGSTAGLWRPKGIEVQLDCQSGLHLDSFPGALNQVLGNLIDNAVLHGFADLAQESINNGSIRIDCQSCSDQHIELCLSDDGVGIDEADLAMIFEPFFTTIRNRGGTGLGLHIAYNLVTQKLGGKIEVHSRRGHGCRFTLRLPVVAPS